MNVSVSSQAMPWRRLVTWIVGNLLGVGVMWLIITVFPFLTHLPGLFISSLLIGIPVGIAQWLVLRRMSHVSVLWLLTIPVGMIAGMFIVFSIPSFWAQFDDESVVALTLPFFIVGVLIGLLQWLVLRKPYRNAWLWLLTTALGLWLSIFLVLGTGLVNVNGFLSVIVFVLLYALITGWSLLYLKPVHAEVAEAAEGESQRSG